MSIDTLIAAQQATGALVPFKPPFTSKPHRRRAFLSAEFAKEMLSTNSSLSVLNGAGHVQAALTRWVNGELVYRDFLKRLDPPPSDIWEIRVTAPTPKWRIFCHFAMKDTLIVWRAHTRNLLGARGSDTWEAAMQYADKRWTKMFPSFQPLSGQFINVFVGENFDGNYKI